MSAGRTDERGRRHLWIGPWSVDPETNVLERGNEMVRVEPKAMDVLMLLAARVGRVFTREELFAAVWPGVIVGDEALTQTIIKLRRALGDNSRSPSYIETIAKRGYRLIAQVRPFEGGDAMPAEADPAPSPRRPAHASRYARRAGWVAGFIAVAVAGAHFLHSIAPAPTLSEAVDRSAIFSRSRTR